jgi:hypothetical protein
LQIGKSEFPIFHGKRRLQISKRRSSIRVADREIGIEDLLLPLQIGKNEFPICGGKRRLQISKRRSSVGVKDREIGIEDLLLL